MLTSSEHICKVGLRLGQFLGASDGHSVTHYHVQTNMHVLSKRLHVSCYAYSRASDFYSLSNHLDPD